MRWPRIQFTLRWMMITVALAAVTSHLCSLMFLREPVLSVSESCHSYSRLRRYFQNPEMVRETEHSRVLAALQAQAESGDRVEAARDPGWDASRPILLPKRHTY